MINVARLAAGRGAVEQPPNPLIAVLGWELRRMRMSRGNWVLAGLAFAFFLALALTQQNVHDLTYSYGTQAYDPASMTHVVITGTSAWGMSITIPRLLLLLFGLFLPFVTADLVARDAQRRTHEILMTTPIPSWAYVWGRYLAGLVLCLGLASLMLLAVLVLGGVFWALGSPPPAIPAILALWAVAVVPATVLVSGVSFALGTLFPRQANLIKVAVLIGWLLGSTFAEFQQGSLNPYAAWDPIGAIMSQAVEAQYNTTFFADPQQIGSAAQATAVVRMVEQQMPDLGPWVLPHLLYAVLGLLMVGLAAWGFRRFRNNL